MLHKLFPNVSKKKTDDNINNILYLCMVEFGWSWDQFQNTPIPIIKRLMKTHEKIAKKNKKGKK